MPSSLMVDRIPTISITSDFPPVFDLDPDHTSTGIQNNEVRFAFLSSVSADCWQHKPLRMKHGPVV